jgi:hypothetical protein
VLKTSRNTTWRRLPACLVLGATVFAERRLLRDFQLAFRTKPHFQSILNPHDGALQIIEKLVGRSIRWVYKPMLV